MSDKKLWFAVDFDGTIVTEAFPKIGEIKERTVEFMKLIKSKGHMIIIWTARSGIYEDDAKKFLIDNGIPFDYINENPEDEFAKRGEQGRKLFAHYYIDDRAVNVNDIETLFEQFENDSEDSIKIHIDWLQGPPHMNGIYKIAKNGLGYCLVGPNGTQAFNKC